MRIVLREHVFEVIPAFPFRRRRVVAGSRNKRIRRYGRGRAHQVGNVARAVWEDLAFDAHDDFRAMVPCKHFRAVVDRCLASDTRAKRLTVEANEQQPDVRIPLILPSVRYMLLPSYSGYSSVSGPVILTKPGSPERMEQSTLS